MHQPKMPDGAEHAVLGFSGQTIKQVRPGLIRLGQRERAIARGAYVVSRDYRASPVRRTQRSLAFRRRGMSSRSVLNAACVIYVMLPGIKQRTFGWPSR